ncbi:MAG: hypothetical protein ACR2QC_09485 [Gammaproteobacteria bacterium]
MRRDFSAQLKKPPNVHQHPLGGGQHCAQFVAVGGGTGGMHHKFRYNSQYNTADGGRENAKNAKIGEKSDIMR